MKILISFLLMTLFFSCVKQGSKDSLIPDNIAQDKPTIPPGNTPNNPNNPTPPYNEGEGDCDDSSECKPGLVCMNTGTKEIESFNNKIDGEETCEKENTGPISDSQVEKVDTFKAYACGDKRGRGVINIKVPDTAQSGDLLMLFLHRTDGPIYPNQDAIDSGGPPLEDGSFDHSWTLAETCHMKNNGLPCTNSYRDQDLVQTLLWKIFDGQKTFALKLPPHLKKNDDGTWKDKYCPEWVTLIVLRHANPNTPIYATARRSPDGSPRTVFPAVQVIKGGYLLLSQSFDDAAAKNLFRPPNNTEDLIYVTGSKSTYGCENDETGFLFGRKTSTSNDGQEYITNGDGASTHKDIMISVSIRPK